MKVVMRRVGALWRGELPLEIAFWHYAIYYGLLINISATMAAIVLVVLDFHIAVAVAMHLLPVPYTIMVMTGVWRSADRYQGEDNFANTARIGVLVWSIFWLAF